jgi:hypothetical protein
MRIPLALFSAALLAVACGRETAASSPAPQASSAAAAAAVPAPAAASDRISGTVVETMDSGGYTYVRLKTASGEAWAAVSQAKVERGAELTVVGAAWMENFESKTLGRKFDRILFGLLETAAGPATDAATLPPGHPNTGALAPPGHPVPARAEDVGPIKVEKAAGGLTVAEVHAQRAKLAGQTVLVRGKVVKFSPAIMDRNWLHLRDGSGSAEKQDDDLTVTTKQTVAVGEVVLVRAKLSVDRDFGAGYVYKVILEDAQIEK